MRSRSSSPRVVVDGKSAKQLENSGKIKPKHKLAPLSSPGFIRVFGSSEILNGFKNYVLFYVNLRRSLELTHQLQICALKTLLAEQLQ